MRRVLGEAIPRLSADIIYKRTFVVILPTIGGFIISIIKAMKTPERWRPSRAVPSLSVFLPERPMTTQSPMNITSDDVTAYYAQKILYCDVTPWRHMTSWPHAMTSHVITKSICAIYTYVTPSKSSKTTFFKMVTLNFDLWLWPSNLFTILPKAMSTSNFRFVSQTVQSWEW